MSRWERSIVVRCGHRSSILPTSGSVSLCFFFFQAEDGIRDGRVTGVQTCALPIYSGSPRQADMIMISGRVSIKMAPVIRRIYDQMLEPKWVISMGACASSAGMFNNYALVAGADKFLPVDVYIPGCPPRPEALAYGFLKLQKQIEQDPELGWRERYKAKGTEEVA